MVLAACLSVASAVAQTYTVLKDFNPGGGPHPYAGLIQGTDGNLYGTTVGGGVSGWGTIFKIDTSGSTFTTLHSFAGSDGAQPYAGLIQATDGNLYGTTYQGGANNYGTIFKIDTAGSTLTTLHSFAGSDGAQPYAGLIQATDGNLYGTTYQGGANNYGTIFKIDTSGSTFTTLHSFISTEAYAYAGLIQGTDGNLYGTTVGTIFKIDTGGSTFTILHSFVNGDGAFPYAGLIQGTDGNLYGTTAYGGAGGYGTIYEIDTNGSTLTRLHSFINTDGATPLAGLVQATDGNLYGTTYWGGANSDGTIFKIDTSGTTFTTLHSFVNGDGSSPFAGLIQDTDGNLYGTTRYGGAAGYGTIFKIDTNGTFTTLHSFVNSDGANPFSGLIQDTDGNLYGTTHDGGANGKGNIFKIDTSGSTLTVLHDFAGYPADGAHPYAGLIQGTDGNLYGTTVFGGAGGAGAIFKIDTNGSTLTVLHSFFASNHGASYPYAGLIQGTDGNLYGTTEQGGSSGDGTIFKIDTNGSTFTKLHNFDGSDGAYPDAGLIQATDGSLYGMTFSGGANHLGTIFKIDTTGSTFTTLHSFAGSDGSYPLASLVQATDGDLYGTTNAGGANSSGTIFRIDTGGSTLTTLHSFAGSDGANPWAGLIQAADGNLYGTTAAGGANDVGVVFRLAACLSPPTAVASGAATICAGGSAPLSGSGGVSCSWTPATGLDNADSCTPLASPSSTSTYTLSVTDANGCVSTNNPTVTVTVDLPTATVSGSTSICQGSSATIQATLTGTSPWSLTWSDGVTQTTASSPATRSVSPGLTTTYTTTTVSDANCVGTSSGSAKVTVNPLPTAVASGSATICAGQSTPLSGSGGVSCSWTPATGLSNAGSCSPTASPASTTTYTLTVTDALGCVSVNDPSVTVTVNPTPAPVITVTHCVAPGTSGLMASVPANAGDTYAWTVVGGTIDSGQGTNAIGFTSGGPGTRMTLSIDETNSASCVGTAADALQVDFGDVPTSDPFYAYVCSIGRDGITSGCGAGNYCPGASVTRAQMAVFLLKAEHGSSYTPPAATGTVFGDVHVGDFAADWIEQLFHEGITGGCGGANYCPDNPVTRAQMAVFLLKAEHGSSYAPPACHGIFADVSCPTGFAVDWVEQLVSEGITVGCGGGNYCPDNPNTRGQMAVFLVKTFGL